MILLTVGAFLAYRLTTRPAPATPTAAVVRTAKAVVAPLELTLRMTGQTSARNFANVTAPLLRGPESRGSLVLMQLVKPGAVVRKGELVAQIDAQAALDHIDDVKDIVSAAVNDIAKRKAEHAVEMERLLQTIRVAKSTADKAALDYRTAEVKTDIERQLLKLSLDEADARYKQQAANIEQRKVSQAADMKILGITLDRHKRHLGRHEHDLVRFTIKAPMDGLAVIGTMNRGGEMANFQQGDFVAPGQPLMKIVDTSSMQVEGSVSQAYSGLMRIGQRVRIGFDAFKDLKLEGKVYSIGALAVGGWRQNNYVRNVPIRILISNSDPRLIPDLSAHCDITLETVPDQLQVPLAGIREANGKTTVLVRNGEGWTEREVQLGRRSNLQVAIVGGLSAGEEIRLN